MRDQFDLRDVEAVRSLDVFDVEFTSSERSEKELADVEQQLLDKDFDAILFTKIIGIENVESHRRLLNNLDRYNQGFDDDYISNQNIYFESGTDESLLFIMPKLLYIAYVPVRNGI